MTKEKKIENCFGQQKSLYFFCKRFQKEHSIPETAIFDIYRRAQELAKAFDSASVWAIMAKEWGQKGRKRHD